METKIDAWLKTYRTESSISPADWEDLPEECRIRLDNFARDEAVHRADHFARDGYLDLDRQDAVRQLVDAMAQAWRLPGDKVRSIVEDYSDSLPPEPGFEFEKLATRLFRRNTSRSWDEIRQQITPSKEADVIDVVFKSADLPNDASLDRAGFLKAMRYAYDAWTLQHPKEAVSEMIDAADIQDQSSIAFDQLQPLIKQRGAGTWSRALDLEQEVDIHSASRDELIRILKRYALIVRREGGLQPPANVDPPSADEATETVDAPGREDVAAPEAERLEAPQLESQDQDRADFQDQDTIEPETSLEKEEEEPLPPEAEDAVVKEAGDGIEVDEEPPAEPSYEEPAASPAIEEQEVAIPAHADEDEEAARALFGDVPGGEDASEETAAYPSDSSNDEEVAEQSYERDEVREENTEDDDASGELTGGEVEEEPPAVDAEDTEEREAAQDRGSSDAEEPQAGRLQDVFVPSPQGDSRDRFAHLRDGSLRDRIVQEMYDGDGTMLDVFLAKLSGAPDWNRAKQFIANEFFRCKLDLHSDLGEEFFLALKDSLRDDRGSET